VFGLSQTLVMSVPPMVGEKITLLEPAFFTRVLA
jgi:hypothetical protein